jgi:7-keto-8-aminopelargonate synthetase-like enzyme
MFVVLGMAKAFAAAGAFIVCPTPELADAIFSCGGPSIFSGPLSPPVLGAAIAAAELLLSNELPALQERMLAQIRRFDDAAARLGLSRLSPSETPIKFLEVGSAQRAAAVCRRLLIDGYFANVAVYPAVGVNAAGVRVLLNLHQTADDVAGVVQSLRDATA